MRVLGISCFYHDSAACLLEDGEIVAAAQEERFTRVKHDADFPKNAARYCLEAAGARSVDYVAFYDKPILKFHRILDTSLSAAPQGLGPFLKAIPVWLRQKLWIPAVIDAELQKLGIEVHEDILFPEHHESHAASAFYPSPFDDAAVISIDGVGEWATTTIAAGQGEKLDILKEIRFPHSLGLLYSAFTYFTGFKVNSGEYKLMGLAPYGEPVYADKIRDHLIDIREDGSFRLDQDYFGYVAGLRMTNDRFAELFGGPRREPESGITRREMDLAASIQIVTEEVVTKMAREARRLVGSPNLCLSGGVALNCVANGKLVREKIFDDIWIQPASGDAGGALGAAFAAYHNALGKPRVRRKATDAMEGSYLGTRFSDPSIKQYLDAKGFAYEEVPETDEWASRLASILADGKIIGLFQGRMEFGPRALGGRSIIGDPRNAEMQSTMNLKIKFRESFRPFAPSCLAEHADEYFDLGADSPYMLLVGPVRESIRTKDDGYRSDDLISWVNKPRSSLPAITHVDYSARLQTVTADRNGKYHSLINAFYDKTGCPAIVNTSFNVRGEPIVSTPEDAYRCFMRTNMDYLVLESFVLSKEQQPKWSEEGNWQDEFALD